MEVIGYLILVLAAAPIVFAGYLWVTKKEVEPWLWGVIALEVITGIVWFLAGM